jgi:hypothetical protein
MSNKPREYQNELDALFDALADYIEHAPGVDLLEDARATGEDPNETDGQVKDLLLRAVTDFEQSKLRAARIAYEKNVAAIEKKPYSFSDEPAERRQQLYFLLGRNPELGAAFTARHRDLVNISDEDVEGALKDLADLGALDDIGRDK